LESDLETIAEQLAEAKWRAEEAERLEHSRELAATEPGIAKELEALEAQMNALREREEQLRECLGIGGQLASFTCPDCGSEHRVLIDRGRIRAVPETTTDPVMEQELEDLVARKNAL